MHCCLVSQLSFGSNPGYLPYTPPAVKFQHLHAVIVIALELFIHRTLSVPNNFRQNTPPLVVGFGDAMNDTTTFFDKWTAHQKINYRVATLFSTAALFPLKTNLLVPIRSLRPSVPTHYMPALVYIRCPSCQEQHW